MSPAFLGFVRRGLADAAREFWATSFRVPGPPEKPAQACGPGGRESSAGVLLLLWGTSAGDS